MSEVLQEIRDALHELRDQTKGPGGLRRVVNVLTWLGGGIGGLYALVGVMGWWEPVVDHFTVAEKVERQQRAVDQLVENVRYQRWFRDYQVCIDTGKSALACQAEADEKKEARDARQRAAEADSSK